MTSYLSFQLQNVCHQYNTFIDIYSIFVKWNDELHICVNPNSGRNISPCSIVSKLIRNFDFLYKIVPLLDNTYENRSKGWYRYSLFRKLFTETISSLFFFHSMSIWSYFTTSESVGLNNGRHGQVVVQ